MRILNKLIILFFALFGLFIVLGKPFVYYYTDYLWFHDLGFERVFFLKFWLQSLLFLVIGGLTGVLFYLNGYLVHKTAVKTGAFADFFDPRFRVWLSEKYRLVLKIVSLSLAILLGLSAAPFWEEAILFLKATSFGKVDPLLGLDISFYVFKLPFWRYLANFAFVLWVLCASTGFFLFLALGHIRSSYSSKLVLTTPFRRYLALMLALFFLRLAFDLWLDRADLLFDERGVVFGAGFTEAKVVLPVLNALVIVSLVSAVLAAIFVFKPRKEILIGLVLAYAGLYFVGLKFLPGIVHKYVVQPNELEREKKYLAYEIKATREAFGLDKVDEQEFKFGPPLTKEVLALNQDTIKNIRLWDHEPLLETFSQIQEIRTYYKFVSVDNDRYRINNELRQVMLSARELSYEDLPSRSWINEHLVYTHGYGLTLGVVNEVTEEGLPKLLIKDIPPVSECNLQVKQPAIYFGEIANEYVIVRTKAREFDYPAGEKNVYTTYNGTTGVNIGSISRRLLFAIRFGSSKILLSGDITSESKILYHRSVSERVRKAAPFIFFDADPYLVISSDGRLFWFVDGYTVSNRYPYSRRVKGVGNYVRNSVLAIVDAYNGNISFYLKDSTDPIIRTYAKIFPGMFKPISDLREDLRHHIRYPHKLFMLQAKLFGAYHMEDPRVFYNQEDLWEIPKSLRDERRYMKPYYTIMKLPGEKQAEFILMIPFNPAKKHNLAAWMCVRCDPDNYGQMLVYRFPKQKLVYGPQQIESRINQDPEISRQLSLWDQRGSRVILGTLLIIPIEGNLLYVQPLYLKAESGQIPELKRVIVAYENEIKMAPTLEGALNAIFGEIEKKPKTSAQMQKIRQEILPSLKPIFDIYLQAEEALKQGDLEKFGRLWRKLGELLKNKP
ncbi:UPF0182 family membrane protein [Thermodesulfatator autotrophicus]|uniref:UPF0182 protein TH606_10965 n=1 Tax=Thermodesulfatator autotrophicus TaxID=1795632 RepID=A0A177E3Z9_9BACT|nr:UPF0182 family protein [Thermodesulfatator autotrophicus]OAG26694.1 hypothetical protein TH606_10965 [Thermodesulfatator autotrophicus]